MARATWLADVLRAGGVTVEEHPGWRTRESPGGFAPVGVLWHHTAFRSTRSNPRPALQQLLDGRPDLAPPLCNLTVDANGVCLVIAAGNANHAGEARASGPVPSAADGNAIYVGIEIDYAGTLTDPPQAMREAQYRTSLLATAAILKHLGRDASFTRGHHETSTKGKVDPFGVLMDTVRADVARTMAGGAVRPSGRLFLVKTANRASGRTEVFRADPPGYNALTLARPTVFAPGEGAGGAFTVDRDHVYFVKTANRASGRIEIFRTDPPAHDVLRLARPSAFSALDGDNGTFSVDGDRLYFVKTANRASGRTEVFRTDPPGYDVPVLAAATAFDDEEGANGVFSIDDDRLYFVKTAATGSGRVEILRADPPTYSALTLARPTVFTPADAANGTFHVDGGRLYLVKATGTGSGRVEIFRADPPLYDKLTLAEDTVFTAADAANGTFVVA